MVHACRTVVLQSRPPSLTSFRFIAECLVSFVLEAHPSNCRLVLFKRSPIVESSSLTQPRRVVFSTTYDWRLNCHLSDASCDCDEEPDAEDHQKGKRRSGL